MTASERSEHARKRSRALKWAGFQVLVVELCSRWRLTAEKAKALDLALRAATTSNRFGAIEILCHVNSLARANDEIAADCWRLWLDGADAPDPRPWADILATGDNKRVVRAERVAFLDWTDLDRAGKPKRKPWSPPAANGPAGDLAAAE